MAKQHSMKDASASPQAGTGNSRYYDKKIGPASSTDQPDSLGGDRLNLGKGTANSRYTSTKPGGNSGTIGPAAVKTGVPTYSPQSASVLGKNVYRSSKPAKR